ncbi:HCL548Wp [Eremothecium sinecaudum]|uniref:proline--tRNA ligase n=1 Tax=Eremothecium sinecaudum TaxID=45286 RepID=A0A109UXZ8_9SACH|nr:HCL548Wp [Eremothecium sinecaudum]AMD19603.1 HCL548Wp [Eremothecium sinecaudum]
MSVLRRELGTFSKRLPPNAIKSDTAHDLLQGLGYISQTQSGLMHWLPMGVRVMRNVQDIIRKRMVESGAFEMELSALSEKSVWLQTNRWGNKELFKLEDRKGKQYCLTPTCEEDFTTLIKQYVSSYKDFPLTVFQMTRKYRDELRPRGGLLRAREFVMKDAYSFHVSEEDAIASFHKMNGVYELIFKDLRLPFVSADADSGDIGGDLSKEFHYIHRSGEDVLYSCTNCEQVSNVEKCSSMPLNNGQATGEVSVTYALNQDHDTLLCFYYPADRAFNWRIASEVMDNDIDMSLKNAGNEKVLEAFSSHNEDPMFSRVVRVMDVRLNSRSNFPDFPLNQYLKNNFSQLNGHSIVDAEQGELCENCGKGTLKAANSIEVGHTFYLGKKYSEPLSATAILPSNEAKPLEMGCYGIGVTRLVAAIAEISRDEKGLCWPSCIAPYKVSLNYVEDSAEVQAVKNLLKYEAFIDNSPSANLGHRLTLSQQLGIPLSLIIGKKHWPLVEIEVRGKRFSDTWLEKHTKYSSAYNWQYEIVQTKKGPLEKHLCFQEHLNEVIDILLSDM